MTTSTATLLPWAPQMDNDVYAIDVADDGSRVFAGGNFSTVNGTPRWSVASLDAVDGSLQAFPPASAVPDPVPGCSSRVKDSPASPAPHPQPARA